MLNCYALEAVFVVDGIPDPLGGVSGVPGVALRVETQVDVAHLGSVHESLWTTEALLRIIVLLPGLELRSLLEAEGRGWEGEKEQEGQKEKKGKEKRSCKQDYGVIN